MIARLIDPAFQRRLQTPFFRFMHASDVISTLESTLSKLPFVRPSQEMSATHSL